MSRYDVIAYINYLSRVLYKYIKAVKINYYKNNINFYLRNVEDITKILLFFKTHVKTFGTTLARLYWVRDFSTWENLRA